MVIPVTRTTGPLTTRLAACEKADGWQVADGNGQQAGEPRVLARYACDCNDITLAQITRSESTHPQFAVVLTCPRDGTRYERPYRLTPWAVEDYVVARRNWCCSECDEPLATVRLFDGVMAGIEIDCPICGAGRNIDLSLSALPPDLRLQIFGIPSPQPILSPPVMRLLEDMWNCVKDTLQDNSFVYVAHTVRYDSGRIVHPGSQHAFSTEASYLEQLTGAGLIDDGERITITELGIDHCRQEFDASTG